jgi:hypothetical protein
MEIQVVPCALALEAEMKCLDMEFVGSFTINKGIKRFFVNPGLS